MNKFTTLLRSSLGRKLMMALTGLFLILFLVIHLIGNLQLLAGDGGEAFNRYSYFMANNGLIQLVSKLNFTFIVLHVIYSIWLARTNAAARPIPYGGKAKSVQATWNSRNMGILGTLILLFLIVHLKSFWFEFKFGTGLPMIEAGTYDGLNFAILDAYTVVATAYSTLPYMLIYVVGMLVLSFHLYHGFQSAFQTLGLGFSSYKKLIEVIGVVYAIIVPLLFAIIPVAMYLQQA
ncbi:MAG: succinate dehydrogenase cytochrome b subunit [Sphingobacteriaceae bacterium]|nr:succinate dehydrogenase cytochrome b subunit [Sphingobacteriaceae bacterium]